MTSTNWDVAQDIGLIDHNIRFNIACIFYFATVDGKESGFYMVLLQKLIALHQECNSVSSNSGLAATNNCIGLWFLIVEHLYNFVASRCSLMKQFQPGDNSWPSACYCTCRCAPQGHKKWKLSTVETKFYDLNNCYDMFGQQTNCNYGNSTHSVF
jgi:hypothetical protein